LSSRFTALGTVHATDMIQTSMKLYVHVHELGLGTCCTTHLLSTVYSTVHYSTCYRHATGLNEIVRSRIRLLNLLYKHLLSTVNSTVHATDMLQASMKLYVHEFGFGTRCIQPFTLYFIQYMLSAFLYIGTRRYAYNNVYFPTVNRMCMCNKKQGLI
jgi:hypothetical protein